jgi:hypothetical protein
MNDPVLNSARYDWDVVCPAKLWKKTHNYEHHTFTSRDAEIVATVRPVCRRYGVPYTTGSLSCGQSEVSRSDSSDWPYRKTPWSGKAVNQMRRGSNQTPEVRLMAP